MAAKKSTPTRDVTLLKHKQRYAANVKRENADGSLDLVAIAANGQDFVQTNVAPAPEDFDPEVHHATAYWTIDDTET